MVNNGVVGFIFFLMILSLNSKGSLGRPPTRFKPRKQDQLCDAFPSVTTPSGTCNKHNGSELCQTACKNEKYAVGMCLPAKGNGCFCFLGYVDRAFCGFL
ncbi:hypothetical protein Bca101_011456 [Brassica carinata]